MDNVMMIEGADIRAISDWLKQRLDEAAKAAPGATQITMPGGSTPFPVLADMTERFAHALDWQGLTVWPNDDRIVPEDHEASNTGKMRALLEPMGAGVQALSVDSVPPRFALTWLGMGPDGHIASLFPNTDPQIDEPASILRLTPDPLPAHAPFDRITLTLPALLNTDGIVFTLGGSADKLSVFEAALREEHDLPIARLLRAAKKAGVSVTCFT